MTPWPELKWWNSGERQVCEEKIDDLERQGITCNPEKDLLYQALREVEEKDCKVCIVGQDPYPNPIFATGVAFSIPRHVSEESFPGTLRLILKEYVTDTHNSFPSHGDLRKWCTQGVLLWNAIPSVQQGRPLSNDWNEWSYLTSEIIRRLSERGVVFAFLGAIARNYSDRVSEGRNRIVVTGHPSVRGNLNSKNPFNGSRIFTTINAKLRELKKEPIDWCLTDTVEKKPVIASAGKVLPNVNNHPISLPSTIRLPRRAESTFSLEE
jgi:uracil-DNA glycosylase